MGKPYEADVRAASSAGQTPLDFALQSKNEDVIHLLQTHLE